MCSRFLKLVTATVIQQEQVEGTLGLLAAYVCTVYCPYVVVHVTVLVHSCTYVYTYIHSPLIEVLALVGVVSMQSIIMHPI